MGHIQVEKLDESSTCDWGIPFSSQEENPCTYIDDSIVAKIPSLLALNFWNGFKVR